MQDCVAILFWIDCHPFFYRNTQNSRYFMWSEGGWTGPDDSVAYAIADSPFGPFDRVGKILQQDSTIATGAGHHSVIHAEEKNKWFIIYHRRPLGETDGKPPCNLHRRDVF
jgi:hypothetical protein